MELSVRHIAYRTFPIWVVVAAPILRGDPIYVEAWLSSKGILLVCRSPANVAYRTAQWSAVSLVSACSAVLLA